MFAKILIANRGEIACRVIATARRMGIRTVAVYSDADAQSRHVAMADEAVHIGAAPVSESYLQSARIIEAALKTGAEAIHPGYGFLSENPDFVTQAQKAGLTFIGPPARAIRAMGLKDAAKALMEKANVPVVPGYHGPEQDPERLGRLADKIGYPVLIKARAGGGGKGMRLVENPADFAENLAAAQREGAASFGDPACLIEKYITAPRHIEIQIFADAHGNVVHLFERDCSLQRRHQKVIEEAPAPGMPDDVRAAMGAAAIEAARAIGYQGAGTVEFIADGSGPLRADGFWFMEMNTRLQVEHPVTEAITGLDLVAEQIRVAAGAPLSVSQNDLTITGHAFEARIYAEDAARGFLPAIGRLEHLAFPTGNDFAPAPVRIDSGVRAGDTITPHYDPMIAKLITHGPDRETALSSLAHALEHCEIAGLTTNLGFLRRLALHDGFAKGAVDTGLIARGGDTLTQTQMPSQAARALAHLAALDLLAQPEPGTPFTALTGWRAWGPATATSSLVHEDTDDTASLIIHGPGHVTLDGTEIRTTANGPGWAITLDGQTHQLRLHSAAATITVFEAGEAHAFTRRDPTATQSKEGAGGDVIRAPMPGQVTALSCETGASVSAGDTLMVLEAMKMEHALTAPRDGVIAEVLAQPGDQVHDGMDLIRLEPADDR